MNNEVIWNVWLTALKAAMENPNVKGADQAVQWADYALEQFKARFS